MTAEADTLNSTLERIVAELDQCQDRLPEDAILEARRYRDQIVPYLIRAIREATSSVKSGDEPRGDAPFFALYLLTEFRAQQALPAIVEAISLPGEMPFDLFGDAVTELLDWTLATLAFDQQDVLHRLIADPACNESVRIEAAGAFLYLVRDGHISREDAVSALLAHYRAAIEAEDVDIVTMLSMHLLDLGSPRVRDEIHRAFAADLIDPVMIKPATAEEELAAGDETFRLRQSELRYDESFDTVEELRGWHWFSERSDSSEAFDEHDTLPYDDDIDDVDDDGIRLADADTIRNEAPRIGRNEPCPCGSGKKFKKCCGGR